MRHLRTVAIIGQLGLLGIAIGVTAAGWLNMRIVIHLGFFGHLHYPPYSDPAHYAVVGLLAGLSAALGFLVPPRPSVTGPH